MTLLYTLIFTVTLIELGLILLLLFPFNNFYKEKFLLFLINIQTKLKIWLYIIFAIISICFLDSVNTALNSQHPNKIHNNNVFDPYSHCKVFYAQRNIYLTMITLVLGLILYRLPYMFQLEKLEKKEKTDKIENVKKILEKKIN